MKESRKHPGGRVRRPDRNCVSEREFFGARPSGRFTAPCFTAVGVVRSSDSVGTLKRHECRAPGVLLSWVADIFGGVIRSSNGGSRGRSPHRLVDRIGAIRRLRVLFVKLAVAFVLGSASAQAADAGGDAVECANLIYAGTKSSVCFSEEFLSTVATETSINTSRKFKPVKLGDKEVFRFPFAVMTGEGAFALTDEERANLKLYLEKGGFLLASAGCSSKEWGDSFVREMEKVFPDRALADVPMDHPIFRTVFDIERLETKEADARLQGLTLGGKIVVIFSPDGLNDTPTMHGCCCCGGNEIANSRQVNANILVYALLQ